MGDMLYCLLKEDCQPVIVKIKKDFKEPTVYDSKSCLWFLLNLFIHSFLLLLLILFK